MKVLLVGNGGREHAIAKKIAQSPSLTEFYSIPGNPGINVLAKVANTENTPDSIANWAKDNNIDLMPVQNFRLCRNAHGREQSYWHLLTAQCKG